jgi:hypothetical protein
VIGLRHPQQNKALPEIQSRSWVLNLPHLDKYPVPAMYPHCSHHFSIIPGHELDHEQQETGCD